MELILKLLRVLFCKKENSDKNNEDNDLLFKLESKKNWWVKDDYLNFLFVGPLFILEDLRRIFFRGPTSNFFKMIIFKLKDRDREILDQCPHFAADLFVCQRIFEEILLSLFFLKKRKKNSYMKQ
jgi:hypothetical protein